MGLWVEGQRARRAMLALPLLLLLTAARTSVAPLPETLAPAPGEHKPGETFTAKAGDVILKGKILDTEVVTLEAPISVSIAKFSQDIPAGTKLDPVLAPPRTERLTGTSGRYYCGEDQQARSKFMAAMIGDFGSKFETVVRFCFVDSDEDSKLDQVFLAGAKDAEFQKSLPIEPTAFRREYLQPDDEQGEVTLTLHKFKPQSNRVQFMLKVHRNGTEQYFTYIATVKDDKMAQTYPRIESNPKKYPYPSTFTDILGASVSMLRVDAEKGEADLRINRPFRMQLFKPVSVTVTYVYIYY